jgi:hypothetical protein
MEAEIAAEHNGGVKTAVVFPPRALNPGSNPLFAKREGGEILAPLIPLVATLFLFGRKFAKIHHFWRGNLFFGFLQSLF